MENVFGSLFEKEPSNYNTPGDKAFWFLVKERYGIIPLNEMDESTIALIIHVEYRGITEKQIEKGKMDEIKKCSRSGMPEGKISADFCLKTMIPLLQSRLKSIYEAP